MPRDKARGRRGRVRVDLHVRHGTAVSARSAMFRRDARRDSALRVRCESVAVIRDWTYLHLRAAGAWVERNNRLRVARRRALGLHPGRRADWPGCGGRRRGRLAATVLWRRQRPSGRLSRSMRWDGLWRLPLLGARLHGLGHLIRNVFWRFVLLHPRRPVPWDHARGRRPLLATVDLHLRHGAALSARSAVFRRDARRDSALRVRCESVAAVRRLSACARNAMACRPC
jgi:hypothetical protein